MLICFSNIVCIGHVSRLLLTRIHAYCEWLISHGEFPLPPSAANPGPSRQTGLLGEDISVGKKINKKMCFAPAQ